MKLAFCLFRYSPFSGLGKSCLNLAYALRDHGHTIEFYAQEWIGPLPKHCKLILLASEKWTNHKKCLDFAIKIQSHLKRSHYDLVIGFNKIPNLDIYYAADKCLAQILKTKSPLLSLLPRYKTYLYLEKLVFDVHQKTQIFLQTSIEKKYIQAHYHTPENRIYLLPPGISKTFQKPRSFWEEKRISVKRSFDISPNMYLLLSIGSGFKTKGIDRSLQAIAALPNSLRKKIQFWVIGKDKIDSWYKLAKKLGVDLYVHFLGPRYDVQSLLLAADLLLHPARLENAGTILLEALSTGLPIIATKNCGYAPYITQAKAGLLIEEIPYNQKEYNMKLAYMLSTLPQQNWRENALNYMQFLDCFHREEFFVKTIEEIAQKK